jgi:uncharacterized membrane protein YoaK (UPF0700 family)
MLGSVMLAIACLVGPEFEGVEEYAAILFMAIAGVTAHAYLHKHQDGKGWRQVAATIRLVATAFLAFVALALTLLPVLLHSFD